MLKNIGSNWTLNVVQILVFMVLTPYTLEALQPRTYGVWEYIVSATGPLQLLVLGVPMATVRAISASLGKSDPKGANQALGESITLTLVMGTVALVAGLVLYALFPGISAGWNLEPDRIDDARTALLIITVHLAAGFCLRLPYAVFDAHQDFIVRNLIMATGFFVKLGLTVLLLSLRANLTTLAAVQLLVATIEFTLSTTISAKRHAPVRFRPGPLNWAGARSILSFSIFAFLLNMGALLAFRLDALVIGAYMEPEDVTVYGMGNKIFDPFINLLLAIGMVVMPMATELRAKGREVEVGDIFLKWSKVAGALVLMIGGYLMVLGPAFLTWWLPANSDHVLSGRLLQILMLSFFLFLPVRAVALPILMGLGRPKGPALGLVGMGFANLAISLALVRPYGLTGVALGTAIPNVLFATWFVGNACGQLQISLKDWLGYVVARPALATLICMAALAAADHWMNFEGFGPLLVAGIAYVGLFGLLQVLFVYRGDRYMDLYAALSSKLRSA